MLSIDFLHKIQVSEEIKRVIKLSVEKTLLMEESENCEVSIYLTDDDEIQELNKVYRDVDAPTDVLAFAMRDGIDGDLNREILGDVVISVPTAEKQARDYGHSAEAEMSLLVSHGILHLLGYDHAEEHEAKVMEQKQKEVVHSLGFELNNRIIGA